MSQRRKLFFYHKPVPEMKQNVDALYALAEKNGFILEKDYRKADIIASIGGNDAFLLAVRNTGFRDDCLYAGISLNDERTFYCDFRITHPEEVINSISNDNIEVRRYPTIDVDVDGETSFQCLNEFSLRSSIIKTIVIDVFIDDLHFETFRGDGMIVSTPTGSTGYNRSLRGSIVDPLLPCIQVSELASLNNNQYRTLGSSFLLSGSRKLLLHIVQDGNDFPIMGMDNEALSIQHVRDIEIKLSNKTVKTIKLKDNSFWEKVKRNFLN
ncbi:NAD kinase [Bacillus sp. B15-48]|uniref:NAD kinase n=1 Tax=Bacillus sp. B15-48 TaxID=1548601 RepID=UPI00193EF77B|nr:NAD kinase [Bacillus sp. B15-48]MBM4762567.1 NAD kinase [Bacillus sp. B15-48]